MAESENNQPEKKISPNRNFVKDCVEYIPFAKPVWNFFIREGKAVRNGWLAFAVIAGFFFWWGHSHAERNVDSKLSGTTNYFSGRIDGLNDELKDAKHDRDHYQEMLAPFQAMAIAKYTNAPMDQRLDLLADGIAKKFTNVVQMIERDRPVIHLEVNGVKIQSYESAKPGSLVQMTPMLLTNRQIQLKVMNDSEVTAEHITISFRGDVESSNVLADQWISSPFGTMPSNWNQWYSKSDNSIPYGDWWAPQTIQISPNFARSNLITEFTVHADRSKNWAYAINFILSNN